jgi:hypothetical protein
MLLRVAGCQSGARLMSEMSEIAVHQWTYSICLILFHKPDLNVVLFFSLTCSQ